mmetsp:Transcript_58746/g.157393  ORF Transcript_58746/g.157393 Transcript_58746/m.157393 type:complete len:204 (-) Transcript_58746:37-648(-)
MGHGGIWIVICSPAIGMLQAKLHAGHVNFMCCLSPSAIWSWMFVIRPSPSRSDLPSAKRMWIFWLRPPSSPMSTVQPVPPSAVLLQPLLSIFMTPAVPFSKERAFQYTMTCGLSPRGFSASETAGPAASSARTFTASETLSKSTKSSMTECGMPSGTASPQMASAASNTSRGWCKDRAADSAAASRLQRRAQHKALAIMAPKV